MKNLHHIFFVFVLGGTLLVFTGCSQSEGNRTGHEYMPDMGHSAAYEANVVNEYFAHTWDDNPNGQTRRELSQPRKPVDGTVARGYASVALANSPYERQAALARLMNERIPIPMNGAAPYYYGDTDAERLRASAEITQNPFSPTDARLKSGKELYTIYCGICHGDTGGGDGYLVRDDGKYPVQPANLLDATFTAATEGQYYHAIMYGKNVMGSYADKLSYEERWNVIHYIRSLQATASGGTYGVGTGGDTTASLSHDDDAQSFVETGDTTSVNAADVHGRANTTIEKIDSKSGGDLFAQVKSGSTVTLDQVIFAFGKARIRSSSLPQLDNIATFLVENPTLKAEISGHTNPGIKAKIKKLSQERADNVRTYLISKGVKPANLIAVGYGDEKLLDDSKTDIAKKRNRRTEFKIIK